ncbi:hypothetical protein BLOT_009982 [Blomia tropicalis]|nr:hypothetical protein BLOT_009982 [Blomia tropicalis]
MFPHDRPSMNPFVMTLLSTSSNRSSIGCVNLRSLLLCVAYRRKKEDDEKQKKTFRQKLTYSTNLVLSFFHLVSIRMEKQYAMIFQCHSQYVFDC